MKTRFFALFVAAAMGVATVAAADPSGRTTRGAALPTGTATAVDPNHGCCWDPDVVEYGHHIDFTGFVDGYEVTTQYRSQNLLFGEGATVRAPKTVVRYDYSRLDFNCRTVLNGDPIFQGWEFFIFVDPVQNKFATVQNVGVDIGYADLNHSNFLAAYDVNGNFLEAKFNTKTGFQFLKIERPTADIARVMTGDCLGSGLQCYPDEAGSAINCLTFSTPVANSTPLPETIEMPPAPTTVGLPGTSPWTMTGLAMLLAAGGIAWFRRRVKSEIS
jgi:hypothetical protein